MSFISLCLSLISASFHELVLPTRSAPSLLYSNVKHGPFITCFRYVSCASIISCLYILLRGSEPGMPVLVPNEPKCQHYVNGPGAFMACAAKFSNSIFSVLWSFLSTDWILWHRSWMFRLSVCPAHAWHGIFHERRNAAALSMRRYLHGWYRSRLIRSPVVDSVARVGLSQGRSAVCSFFRSLTE